MSDNTFNEKLDEIIDELQFDYGNSTVARNERKLVAKLDIIDLINRDVIGQDEDWNAYQDPSEASIRNTLKAEMRQRLQEYIK